DGGGQQWKKDHAADHAVDEVADGQAPIGRVESAGAFKQRIHRRAEVCADDQREGFVRRGQARSSQRHGQHHDGYARVGRPGQYRTTQHGNQRFADQGGDQLTGHRGVLGQRQRVEQAVQRKQHQPQTDGGPAEIPYPGAVAPFEGEDTTDQQNGRDGRGIERQQLNDERRAYVGAQHDRQRRRQGYQARGGK